MSAAPSSPELPERGASAGPAPLDFQALLNTSMNSIDDAILKIPGMEESVREVLIARDGTERDHVQGGTSIDRDALREEMSLQDRIKLYCTAFVEGLFSKKVVEAIGDTLDPKNKESLRAMLTSMETFAAAQRESGLALVTASDNVILPKSGKLVSTLSNLASLLPLNGKPVTKEGQKEGLKKFLATCPLGGTVVTAEKEMKFGPVRYESLLQEIGVNLEVMSPTESAIAGPVDENAVRFVMVQENALPKQGEGWNLNVVDNLAALYERGATLWREPQLVASVLVRQGVPVEQALAASGLGPSADPEVQANYDALLTELKTLPVKGQTPPVEAPPPSPPTNV